MHFYHFSEKKLDKLIPQVGPDRHEGEDELAIGEPVVFLTNSKGSIFMNKDDEVYKYRYTVSIAAGDNKLFIDRKHEQTINDFNLFFGSSDTTRWYFYKGELTIKKIDVWNGKEYMPIK